MANSSIQELMGLVNSSCPGGIFTGLQKYTQDCGSTGMWMELMRDRATLSLEHAVCLLLMESETDLL